MLEKNKHEDIDKLLNDITSSVPTVTKLTLKQLFEHRLSDLGLAASAAAELIGIEWRALTGIIDGTQKRVDFITMSKMARFLNIQNSELIEIYLQALEKNYKDELVVSDKIKFILENFDLTVLKSVGFIDNVTDYEHIENQINAYFGFKSIFEYSKANIHPAFSAGAIRPKNASTRDFWITSTRKIFEKIDNPNEYDRKGMMEFFPKIRWHSMNVEKGLFEVIKSLYSFGVTVMYQPSMPTLHLRGATFSINNKPCIVLTDYRGFYPTLWFALIHELYHVLFDWDEIKDDKYHLSSEDLDFFTLEEKEADANKFSREYLFSMDKLEQAKPNINNRYFIDQFAKSNHVHPSIIYIFNAFDSGKEDKKIWVKIKRQMPKIELCLNPLGNISWAERTPISKIANKRKSKIFNN